MGAAFGCAVLWKAVLSPDYLDGRFFRVTLMTDDRFSDLVMIVGGMTQNEVVQTRAALEPLPEGAALADPRPVREPVGVRVAAAIATWVGLGLEFLVAACCLWPGTRLERVRHAAILAFCTLTYMVAPVAGFGWLLVAMGLAQSRDGQRAFRVAYIAVFFVVLAFSELPRTILEPI
jgi:hypothetical protein